MGLLAFTLPTKWIQINSWCAILLGVIWLGHGDIVNRLRKVVSCRLFIILTGVFFLSVLSLFYSQNLQSAFSGIETKLSILLFPLIILSMPK
ncbi:MAG: hypothetical protein ACKO96_22800, partial [Flammeovirgaceae bacterium]